MAYRKDIDGLRALAVLPVVLYHAGFEVFSGGFVGVDVFFVISGYLITGIIAGEISESRFSILKFYERRIRRIFPALFVVLLFTWIAGVLILLPTDLVAMGKSMISATLFMSNLLFWRESGYFETVAEMKPLLHTWSLAVEEQYYIFFPLFLIIAWRMGQRWKSLTWTGLLLSFAMSVYGIRYHDEATFYLLPTRAWELLTGSVIALGAVPKLNHPKIHEILAAFGIALIVYAIFAYDRTTPFPGESALAPCLGAALIIYAGTGNQDTWAARLLSLRPVVLIGLISYSLYLWHWPLVVYTKYYLIFPLNDLQAGLVVAASCVMAALSWRYVEAPFRKGKGTVLTRSQLRLFTSSGVIMSLVIGSCLSLIILHGLPHRMDEGVAEIVSDAKVGWKRSASCMNSREESNYHKPESSCVFGPNRAHPDVVVWGDSHAGALIPGILKAMEGTKHGFRTLMMSGCPPILGVNLSYSPHTICREYNAMAMDYIRSGPERVVIIAGRWAAATQGGLIDGDERSSPPGIAKEPGQKLDRAAATRLLDDAMRKTLHQLTATGKHIVLVYPAPESDFDVPSVLARLKSQGRAGEADALFIRESDFKKRAGSVVSLFDALPDAANFRRIKPAELLCNKTLCALSQSGRSLYLDPDHLSKAGAELISPLFSDVFAGGTFVQNR